ncbi:hypothetical protein MRY87_09260 [bacterium]|nr:hypothetical protein [bacterium]
MSIHTRKPLQFFAALALSLFLSSASALAQSCEVESIAVRQDTLSDAFNEQRALGTQVLAIRSTGRLVRMDGRLQSSTDLAIPLIYDLIPPASEECGATYDCFVIDNFARLEDVLDEAKQNRRTVRRMVKVALRGFERRTDRRNRRQLFELNRLVGETTRSIKTIVDSFPNESRVCLPN